MQPYHIAAEVHCMKQHYHQKNSDGQRTRIVSERHVGMSLRTPTLCMEKERRYFPCHVLQAHGMPDLEVTPAKRIRPHSPVQKAIHLISFVTLYIRYSLHT